MFYQIFLSLEEKQSAIITYKHRIYEFPHELLNNLIPKILGNDEILQKYLKFMDWWSSAHSACQNENFLNSKKIVQKNSD